MGYTFDIFTTCYGKLFCSCLWPLACAWLIFSGQNIGTFTILMPSVFLPLPFPCMSGNSQLYRYWFCKQGGHLRNCGIMSYPVLPPSSSPPFFHQFFHYFFPPFFPTCLFEVKISKRTFSLFFSPSRGDQVKNKKPLGEKQARGFSPSRGDQVSKIPRGKLIGSIFHHARGKISPPPGQNFTSNLTAKLATRFAKFRIKSHFKFHHKIRHKISPQDSPQDSSQTRYKTRH